MPPRLRLLLMSAFGTASAFSHEVGTHRRIGDLAVAYLQEDSQRVTPPRPLLPDLQASLHRGAGQEDLEPLPGAPCPVPFQTFCPVIGRYYFHFDPPLTSSGNIPPYVPILGNSTFSAQASCRSDEWGLDDRQCNASLSGVLLGGIPFSGQTTQINDYRWSRDLGPDSRGAPSTDSIKGFGYVVHLVEDLGSPAHTWNDMHACPILLVYCDPFEKANKDRPITMLSLPRGSAAMIPTDGFTTRQEFFAALRDFVRVNYYSYGTVFTPNDGPCSSPSACFEDENGDYFYGPCLVSANGFNLSAAAGTCRGVLIQGLLRDVRKIAHKGALYKASCVNPMTGCIKSWAEIDEVIAREQFDELGPVIAQHIADFIRFYAPAVSVSTDGTPNSGIISDPPGISCGATCAALFVNGTNVQLTAQVPTGYAVEWLGACSGTNPVVTISSLNSDTKCNVVFHPNPAQLTVGNSGIGAVRSIPTGIDCGATCSASFGEGTQVILTATAGPGYVFRGWGGSCAGTNPVVSLIISGTASQTCFARFEPSRGSCNAGLQVEFRDPQNPNAHTGDFYFVVIDQNEPQDGSSIPFSQVSASQGLAVTYGANVQFAPPASRIGPGCVEATNQVTGQKTLLCPIVGYWANEIWPSVTISFNNRTATVSSCYLQ